MISSKKIERYWADRLLNKNEVSYGTDEDLDHYRIELILSLLKVMMKYNHIEGFGKLLDFGCGHCRFLEFLKSFNLEYYMGVDLVDVVIKHNAKKYEEHDKINFSTIQKKDILDYRFDSFFNSIFSVTVLQHVISEKELLRYIKRFWSLLKEGGCVFVTENISPCSISIKEKRKKQDSIFSFKESKYIVYRGLDVYRKLFEGVGFKLLDVNTVSLTPNKELHSVFIFEKSKKKKEKRTMKAVLIAHNPLWSASQMRGGEYSIANIVEYMAEQGDEVYIFQNGEGMPPHKNIKIFPNKGIAYMFNNIPEDIDVMFSWSSGGGEVFSLYRKFGIPYIYNIRFWRYLVGNDWMGDKIINKKPHNLRRDWFENAKYLISNSRYVREVVRKFYGLDSVVVYPPVSPYKIVVDESEKTPKYITVIGDNPQSGHVFLGELARSFPDLRFWSIGHTPGLRNDQENWKIDKSYIQDRKEIYRRTKILLVPRQYDETYGRIALEAMLNGIPVICSACGGMEEIVLGKYVVSNFKNDKGEWMEKIKYVLNNYSAISEEVRKHAQSKKFDYNENCRKFRRSLLKASEKNE